MADLANILIFMALLIISNWIWNENDFSGTLRMPAAMALFLAKCNKKKRTRYSQTATVPIVMPLRHILPIDIQTSNRLVFRKHELHSIWFGLKLIFFKKNFPKIQLLINYWNVKMNGFVAWRAIHTKKKKNVVVVTEKFVLVRLFEKVLWFKVRKGEVVVVWWPLFCMKMEVNFGWQVVKCAMKIVASKSTLIMTTFLNERRNQLKKWLNFSASLLWWHLQQINSNRS